VTTAAFINIFWTWSKTGNDRENNAQLNLKIDLADRRGCFQQGKKLIAQMTANQRGQSNQPASEQGKNARIGHY
jgi:hypothetical protein